jgi:hypothetical protein
LGGERLAVTFFLSVAVLSVSSPLRFFVNPGMNGASHMFHSNGNKWSDKLYTVESLEPRRLLSVAPTEAVAPTDPAAPVPASDNSYSADTWGGATDSAPVPQATDGSSDAAPTDQGGDDGPFSATDWGDGSGVVAVPTVIFYGGVKSGSHGHSHQPNNAAPPPAQATGFIKPADANDVVKSVLGLSDKSLLD